METINFGAADKPVVRYTPTMDLRFVLRKVKLDPFYQPNVAEVSVLQQRHIGSDGSTRWYDVPMIDEPIEPEGYDKDGTPLVRPGPGEAMST